MVTKGVLPILPRDLPTSYPSIIHQSSASLPKPASAQ